MAGHGSDQLGRKLLHLKESLEKKKAQRSELQGELKSLMKQLKELGVDSVEQAQQVIQKQEQEIEEIARDVQAGITEIERLMSSA